MLFNKAVLLLHLAQYITTAIRKDSENFSHTTIIHKKSIAPERKLYSAMNKIFVMANNSTSYLAKVKIYCACTKSLAKYFYPSDTVEVSRKWR